MLNVIVVQVSLPPAPEHNEPPVKHIIYSFVFLCTILFISICFFNTPMLWGMRLNYLLEVGSPSWPQLGQIHVATVFATLVRFDVAPSVVSVAFGVASSVAFDAALAGGLTSLGMCVGAARSGGGTSMPLGGVRFGGGNEGCLGAICGGPRLHFGAGNICLFFAGGKLGMVGGLLF